MNPIWAYLAHSTLQHLGWNNQTASVVSVPSTVKVTDRKQMEAASSRLHQNHSLMQKSAALEAKHGFRAACAASRIEISGLDANAERKEFVLVLGKALGSFFAAPTLTAGQMILAAVAGLVWLPRFVREVLAKVRLLVGKMILAAKKAEAIAQATYVAEVKAARVAAAEMVTEAIRRWATPAKKVKQAK